MCHHATSTVASHIILHTLCIHIVFQRTPTAEHVWTLLATLPALVITFGGPVRPGPQCTGNCHPIRGHRVAYPPGTPVVSAFRIRQA